MPNSRVDVFIHCKLRELLKYCDQKSVLNMVTILAVEKKWQGDHLEAILSPQ